MKTPEEYAQELFSQYAIGPEHPFSRLYLKLIRSAMRAAYRDAVEIASDCGAGSEAATKIEDRMEELGL